MNPRVDSHKSEQLCVWLANAKPRLVHCDCEFAKCCYVGTHARASPKVLADVHDAENEIDEGPEPPPHEGLLQA